MLGGGGDGDWALLTVSHVTGAGPGAVGSLPLSGTTGSIRGRRLQLSGSLRARPVGEGEPSSSSSSQPQAPGQQGSYSQGGGGGGVGGQALLSILDTYSGYLDAQVGRRDDDHDHNLHDHPDHDDDDDDDGKRRMTMTTSMSMSGRLASNPRLLCRRANSPPRSWRPFHPSARDDDRASQSQLDA
jgi:hypothetical protein